MPHELTLTTRTLTAIEFEQLTAMPPELEWFANIRNPQTSLDSHHSIRT
jgi:hypothetical protein